MNEVEELKDIHYKIKGLVDSQSWNASRRYMRTIRETGDVNKIKMVLVATQGLVNHPEVKEQRLSLYKRFNQLMGWPHKEWPIFKETDPNYPKT